MLYKIHLIPVLSKVRQKKSKILPEEICTPSFYANYSVTLPHNQSLSIRGIASLGKNRYSSLYSEDGQTISSVVDEDNYGISADAMYAKSFKNNMRFSATLSHDHMTYNDVYSGSSAGTQNLSTDVSQGLLEFSHSGKNIIIMCLQVWPIHILS